MDCSLICHTRSLGFYAISKGQLLKDFKEEVICGTQISELELTDGIWGMKEREKSEMSSLFLALETECMVVPPATKFRNIGRIV